MGAVRTPSDESTERTRRDLPKAAIFVVVVHAPVVVEKISSEKLAKGCVVLCVLYDGIPFCKLAAFDNLDYEYFVCGRSLYATRYIYSSSSLEAEKYEQQQKY